MPSNFADRLDASITQGTSLAFVGAPVTDVYGPNRALVVGPFMGWRTSVIALLRANLPPGQGSE